MPAKRSCSDFAGTVYSRKPTRERKNFFSGITDKIAHFAHRNTPGQALGNPLYPMARPEREAPPGRAGLQAFNSRQKPFLFNL
ncbi:MAG: hypothetical protein M5U26_10555 [Planctomycetota bacterium]|nr:hypothetical protein [Planctomycetota bacterium]